MAETSRSDLDRVIQRIPWVVVGFVVWRAGVMLDQNLRWALAGLGPWGGDFHGGAWLAAQQILHGNSPYLPADPTLLLRFSRAFVTPPALGLLAVPVAHLPYTAAVGIWNLLDALALIGALRLLQVRDLRMHLLALFAAPFISSLVNGQVEGVFALLLALAWRHREQWVGAVAVGLLIAAKLYAFPLVFWFIATRRFRSAAITAGSALLVLLGSWALIGFHGLLDYPRLLSAASHAASQDPGSLSPSSLVVRLGAGHTAGMVVGIAFGLLLSALTLLTARDRDEGRFAAAITLGLFASPILWNHYLVLLFVPLAVSRPRSLGPWLLTSLFWTPYLFTSPTARALDVLVFASAVPVLAVGRRRDVAVADPLAPALV